LGAGMGSKMREKEIKGIFLKVPMASKVPETLQP